MNRHKSLIFKKSNKIASRHEHTAFMTTQFFIFFQLAGNVSIFLLESTQAPAILFPVFMCCSLSIGLLFPQVTV